MDKLKFMIKELTVSLYTDLADTDKQILADSLIDLLQLGTDSAMKRLHSLYISLSQDESSIKKSNVFNEFSVNEGYQKALQKLDSEIRTHIKYEFQMKVFIETLEEKIQKKKLSELNENPEGLVTVDKLIEQNEGIQNKINLKREELRELKKITKVSEELELLNLREKVAKENEKILELEKNNESLLKKYARTKVDLDLAVRESRKYQSELIEMKTLADKRSQARSLSRSNEKPDLTKENLEIKGMKNITPKKIDRPVSPVPLTYKQKIMKYAKNAQSSKRIDISPLHKVLNTDASRSKLKPTDISPLQKLLNNDASKSKLKPSFTVHSKKY